MRDKTEAGGVGIWRVGARPEDLPSDIAALEAAWAGARGPRRRLPARRDLDPGALGPALRRCLILQRGAEAGARIRVAGQGICALAGFDLRGSTLGALFAGSDRARLAEALGALFTEPARVELGLLDQTGAPLRLVMLPMLGSDGLSSIGLAALSGQTSAQGIELRLDPAEPVSIRPIGLRRVEDTGTHLEASTLREPLPTEGAPDDEGARSRPVLRLVVDNT